MDDDFTKKNYYVELGANLKLANLQPGKFFPERNVVVPFDEQTISEYRQKHDNTDVYRSVLKYNSSTIRETLQFGPFYADFDGEFGQKDCQDTIRFLTEKLGCPEESVRLYFSGCKGFHLEICPESLGIDPNTKLNVIFGEIAKQIKSSLHLLSMDSQVYDQVRLWRLVNSQHPESGFYKIPLVLEEIEMPLDEIKELAKTPREDFTSPEPSKWTGFAEIFEKAQARIERKDKKSGGIFEPTFEGSRNNKTFKRALKLKEEGKTISEAIEICLKIPDEPEGLSEDEIRRTVTSAYQDKYEAYGGENQKQSMTPIILEKIEEENLAFFHDQYGDGHVFINDDGTKIYKLRSKQFRKWLSYFIWKSTGKGPSNSTIDNVTLVLEGKALFEGEKHRLEVRVARVGEIVWYDLGDGRAIYIVPEGWSIAECPPILFKRFSHQKEQMEPTREGGGLTDFSRLVNLKSREEQILFEVITVAAFIPGFPHPLLVLYGPQGSGKTTPLRLLKSLIDPSELQALAPQEKQVEFVQTASHHWFIFLDNMSHIPDWMSDSLARACTGDGFSKRELYSDDDDIIYTLQRPLGLNGINLVVEKADLLERSVIIGLERISKENRKEEKEIWEQFEIMKPKILGAIFDAVAKALKEYSNISLSSHPRMADFARWGCAIAKALGYTQEEFLNAYYNNLSLQNKAAIDASPVATAVVELLSDQALWEGVPSDLLVKIEQIANTLRLDTSSKKWPKDSSWMTRRLQEAKTNLAEEGIKFTYDKDARPRKITLQKTEENGDGPVGSSQPDDIDSTNEATANKPDNGVPDGDTDMASEAIELHLDTIDSIDSISGE